MKIILLTFFILLNLTVISNAKTYVMHKGSELIAISSENDMVLQDGAEITILNEDIPDLGIVRQLEFYEFKNNEFVLNVKEVEKVEKNKIKFYKKAKELERIERKKNKMAYEALKAEGVKFKEIKKSDFEEVQ